MYLKSFYNCETRLFFGKVLVDKFCVNLQNLIPDKKDKFFIFNCKTKISALEIVLHKSTDKR